MGLDGIPRPACRADGSTEHDVVCEDHIGGQSLAQSCGVEVDVALALGARQILQQPRLEPLVAVEHEHGKRRRRSPDARSRRLRRRRAPGAAPGRTGRPRALRGSTRARASACRRSSRCRPGGTRAREGSSGQVEVQRIEELDGGIRRVDGDVGRHVEQRLGVVEDDLHAGTDQVVRSRLRARQRERPGRRR